jgi:DNA mismatch repair protein MutL
MLDKLADEAAQTDPERLLHEVLDMAACKAAIKAGQPLTDDEMTQLLKDKEIVQRTSRCPHGRPTTLTFSLKELEKQFKRTGF